MRIKISDLKKKFDDKIAVDVPDFLIDDGDIIGLVGNNGAGKTTLFRLMLDLIKADEGNISMGFLYKDCQYVDIDPAKSENWKGVTGAYIDESFLIDFLTPEEYLHFIGKVNGLSEQETDDRISSFAHFMNGEILGQKKLIRNYSAGNKQKIGIISAFINRPQLLILDEPFNFLDPTSQNILKHILEDYNALSGATILISSHNLTHTVDISSRVALLENGRIIKDLINNGNGAEKELEDYFCLDDSDWDKN